MAQYGVQEHNVQFNNLPPAQAQPLARIPIHNVPTVPPGLEHFAHARQFVVRQKKDMAEVFIGWERNNRYEIYNQSGQLVYFAAEDSDEFSLCCLGENRPFCIRVFDGKKRQAVVLNATVDCCTQQVTVEVPQGHVIATIDKEFAFMTPSFYVKNTAGAVMFKIKTPIFAAVGSLDDVKFDILSADQTTVVGQISKKWGGFFREAFTKADTFGITLPPDMDVTWKAVLLAVLFHIDFAFYEN